MIANAHPDPDKSTAPGTVFHRLTVLEDCKPSDRAFKVLCRCTCGNDVSVYRYSLLRGVTKSCGCLRREKASLVIE